MKAITLILSYYSKGDAVEWRDQQVKQIEAHEEVEVANKGKAADNPT